MQSTIAVHRRLHVTGFSDKVRAMKEPVEIVETLQSVSVSASIVDYELFDDVCGAYTSIL